MRRAAATLGIGAAMTACASLPISPAAQARLAAADGLVRQGCYDCLREAREAYQAAAVGRARPLVLPRLFETTLLLGLRERELALDSSATFAAARALAPELPEAYGAARYLELAELVPPDADGTPESALQVFRRAHSAPAANLDAWMTAPDTGGASPRFHQYLVLSLDCTYFALTRPRDQTGPAVPEDAPPLVQYRAGNCPRPDRTDLNAVLAAVPRFVEVDLRLERAQAAVITAQAVARERELLAALVARFPDSPAVTLDAGKLDQRLGDCHAAITLYDRTLALAPGHEQASLQKIVCQSYLNQSDAAIAGATAMIDGHMAHADDARFWRALNLYAKHDLAAARADSDIVKTVRFNDRVMLLAGEIEYDQNDVDLSEKDLHQALQANPESCTAKWYLSLVQLSRQAWGKGADGFVDAFDCYTNAVAADKQSLAATQAADEDPAYKASQVAGLEQAVKDDSGQASASAYNAAANYLRAGDRDKARQYVDIAARDPARAAVAAQLRKLIDGG